MLKKTIAFIPELLSRAVIGSVFSVSGWGKLANLDKTISYFDSIGIPYAHLQGPMVAWVELGAGVLILIGLKTRLASLPLIGIMLVAIKMAKWDDIEDISSLFEVSEFLYIVILSWLAAHGANYLSVDALICRFRKGGSCKTN